MATIQPVLGVLMGGMVMPIMILVISVVVIVIVITFMIMVMVVVSIRLAGGSRGPFPSCPAPG